MVNKNLTYKKKFFSAWMDKLIHVYASQLPDISDVVDHCVEQPLLDDSKVWVESIYMFIVF